MSLILNHEKAQLLLATRQGVFGARIDEGEADAFPFALHGISIRSLFTDDKGVLLAAGSRDRGVWSTRDGGRTFREAPGTAGLDITALAGDSRGMTAGLGDGSLLRERGGAFAPAPLPVAGGGAVSTVLAAEGSTFVGLSTGGLLVAGSDRDGFTAVGHGLPASVLCLAAGGGRLWAGTAAGLFRSAIASPGTWTAAFSTPGRPAVTAVAIDPQQPEHLVCAVSRNAEMARPGEPKGADAWLYRSEDGGRTWLPGRNPTVQVLRGPITALVFHPRATRRLFAGTSVGELFESGDGGSSFRLAAASLPGVHDMRAGAAIH